MTRRTVHTVATHDGVELEGHLYTPDGDGPFPAVVLFNGGGWKEGAKLESWRAWGDYLADFGIASLAAMCRDSTPDRPMYDETLRDAQAAVRFLRAQAAALRIDPARIGAMGDSAGGHLAAQLCLVPMTDDVERTARGHSAPDWHANVNVVVAVYGIFDMLQQWEHDQAFRPDDQITERYLGGSPMDVRERFYEASPLVHASRAAVSGTRWLLVWGDRDPVVDGERQSVVMIQHLQRAGAQVRTAVVPGAGHYWIRTTPLAGDASSPAAAVAPRIGEFLRASL